MKVIKSLIKGIIVYPITIAAIVIGLVILSFALLGAIISLGAVLAFGIAGLVPVGMIYLLIGILKQSSTSKKVENA